ncbi:MAG: ABATE domain-containing protein [Gemmatimonadota bacterium]|nr:ABATE domain-containing protein [Gemmatimonadota bacterium]MDH4347585.1 ABATE domain-containing protein [Gemmatimonadota bacterium]
MADPEFILLGDALWLDFINTTASQSGTLDALPDPAAYRRWCKAVRAAPPENPEEWSQAVALRSLLTSLARSLDQGRGPPAPAIAALNALLQRVEGHQRLMRVGGGWQLRFAPGRPGLALEAVACSAAATLADPTVQIRHCVGQNCALFFSDNSPNQVRRWCSGQRCGRTGRIERRRASRPAPLLSDG